MRLVEYSCPACEKTIGAGLSLEGTSAACPECNAMIKRWPAPKETGAPGAAERPLPLGDPTWAEKVRAAWTGGDRWAWAVVSVPLVGSAVEWVTGVTLVTLMWAATAVLAALDTYRLKGLRCPVPDGLLLWGVLLVPVYLWKRVPLSWNGKLIFGAWLASFVVSLVLSWQVHQRVEIEDSAQSLVTQIIRDNGGAARCTGVEITSNSGDGYYRAIASLDNGRYVKIIIQKTRTMIHVEMPREW
jgi:DNA-directed RNA polymerase subunit RPC12/RpoP